VQSQWTEQTPDPDFELGPRPPRALVEVLSPWTVLVLAFGCLVLDQVLTMALWSSGHHATAIMVGGLGGVVLPLMLITRALGLSWLRELGLHPMHWWEMSLVTMIAATILPPIYALDVLSERLFPPGREAMEFYTGLVPHDMRGWIGGFLAIVIVGPLAEEILFRGVMFQLGVRYIAVPIAIGVTAILFGISHLTLWMFLPITVLGIVLGMLTWMTRSVSSAWLCHALFNLAAFAELGWFQDPTASRLQARSQHPALWVPSLGLAIVGMVVLGRTVRAQKTR